MKNNSLKNYEILFFQDTPEKAELIFSVIAASYKGQWVLCRHEQRSTYEIPGGHIEPGETPDEAAKRELHEETGAKVFEITKVCTYGVKKSGRTNYGCLYYADIKTFDKLPDMEIAEILLFDDLPENLTYPEIQPHLHEHVKKWLAGVNLKKVYKAIIFDLDGTLFDHFGAVDKSFEKLYSANDIFKGMRIEDFLRLNKTLLEKYFILYKENQISWEEHRIQRVKSLYSHFNVSLSDEEARQKFAEYLQIYESCWQPLDNAPELLEKLKSEGYKLGLITNGKKEQQIQKMQAIEIDKLFDSVVISSEFDFAKPDGRIFEQALNELNVKSNEALYAGDSIRSDICGAVNANIDCVYILREHNQDSVFECKPNYIINNLVELLDII